MNAFTDVWVSPAGSYNLLRTAPFTATPSAQAKLAQLPGVRAVRIYRGGLLDWGQRRIWVIAPPRASSPLLPASQLVEGNLRQATRGCARADGRSSHERSPKNTISISAMRSRCRRPIR